MKSADSRVHILQPGDFDSGFTRDFGGQCLAALTHLPAGQGRAGSGPLAIPPGRQTLAHDHGPRQSLVHVLAGTAAVRWGARLEHSVTARPGATVYIPAWVHHQEINDSTNEVLQLFLLNDATAGDELDLAAAHQLAP